VSRDFEELNLVSIDRSQKVREPPM